MVGTETRATEGAFESGMGPARFNGAEPGAVSFERPRPVSEVGLEVVVFESAVLAAADCLVARHEMRVHLAEPATAVLAHLNRRVEAARKPAAQLARPGCQRMSLCRN